MQEEALFSFIIVVELMNLKVFHLVFSYTNWFIYGITNYSNKFGTTTFFPKCLTWLKLSLYFLNTLTDISNPELPEPPYLSKAGGPRFKKSLGACVQQCEYTMWTLLNCTPKMVKS